MENYFKNQHMEIRIENGVLFVTHYAKVLTVDIVRVGVEVRLEMSKGVSYPMLSDIRNVTWIGKDVRDYLARPENTVLLVAGAMIVKNVFQEVAGNLFIYINRPEVPAKLFTNEEEALKWLESFRIS